MGDLERVIESVSTIINLLIAGDVIPWWGFVIDGILVKGHRISINNQKFCDNRGCNIRLEICDMWEIGQGRYNQSQQAYIL